MKEETFKDIYGFERMYQISNIGRFKTELEASKSYQFELIKAI